MWCFCCIFTRACTPFLFFIGDGCSVIAKACACKFLEATASVGVESRGGAGLFTAFFDATVSVAVAGLFLWGGFDIFEVAVAGLFYGVVLTSLRLL